MQYSVVNYKTVKENSDFRIDGEYFWPDFLKTETIIKKSNSQSVKSLSLDIRYGLNIEPVYTETGINFIRAQNLKEYGIEGEILKIPLSQEKVGNKNLLKSGDLLIVRSGANVGDIGIVTKKYESSTFGSYVIKFDLKNKINPFYVYVFLKTIYGRNQTIRFRSGTAQPNISIPNLNQILIPIYSLNFQEKIKKIFFESEDKINQSQNLYSQAEQIILSELELLGWRPKLQLAFTKNFSDTQKAERFDAEYFQPKYEEIVEAVKKYKGGFDELGNLVKIKKSVEPGSEAYQENGIPFVRVSNLSKFELSDNNQQFISEELYEELKSYQPKKGEVLLSKDATPGMAYYLNEEPQKMIVSGGILRLKIDSKQVLPEYLTLVLNSVIVQKQIERDAGGSIINHWRPDQVKATIIPILKENKQKKIKDLVEKSFNDRKLSKSLLEIAKRGVEMAIEKDENKAGKWIDGEIKNLLS